MSVQWLSVILIVSLPGDPKFQTKSVRQQFLYAIHFHYQLNPLEGTLGSRSLGCFPSSQVEPINKSIVSDVIQRKWVNRNYHSIYIYNSIYIIMEMYISNDITSNCREQMSVHKIYTFHWCVSSEYVLNIISHFLVQIIMHKSADYKSEFLMSTPRRVHSGRGGGGHWSTPPPSIFWGVFWRRKKTSPSICLCIY